MGPMTLRKAQNQRDSGRRLHIRYAAGGLEGKLPGNRPVEIVDLSTAGIAIATSERLLLDNNYSIHLRYRDRQVEFPCKVAWCRLSATRKIGSGEIAPWYLAGLTLRRKLGSEGQSLLSTLQQLALTTLPVRLHGRARLQPRAAPGSPRWCNVEVHRMSQKGLSCEIGTEPMPFICMDLEIPLGNETLEIEGRLTAPAERDPETPGLYQAGIEFWKPSSVSRKVLADFMAAQLSGVRPATRAM